MKKVVTEFIENYKKALLLDKKDKVVSNFLNLSNQIKKIFDEIKSLFSEYSFNLNTWSIGKGRIADAPWLGFVTNNHLMFNMIFYPKLNSFILCIDQKTETESLQKLKNRTIILKNYLNKIFDNLEWKNLEIDEKVLIENGYSKNGRAFSYVAASPVIYKFNIEDFEVDVFIKVFRKIYNIWEKMSLDNFFINFYTAPYIEEIKSKSDYGGIEKLIKKVKDYEDDILNKAEYIQIKDSYSPKSYLIYEKTIERQRHQKIMETRAENGKAAELIVLNYEKKCLIKQNLPHLAKKVAQLTSDGDGYDILSYYPNGEIKKIEVKSNLYSKMNHFYISKKEWEKYLHNDIVIYYVFRDFESDKLSFYEFKNPNLLENFIEPVQFKVYF